MRMGKGPTGRGTIVGKGSRGRGRPLNSNVPELAHPDRRQKTIRET